MKECITCKDSKPLDEFGELARSSDGYANICFVCKRQYNREYHAKTAEQRRKSVREKQKKLYYRNRSLITNYLESHPCIDCGESDIIVLDFDHARGVKSANVSDMVRRCWSTQKIMIEIAKCEVRCANCHRRVTHARRVMKTSDDTADIELP